MKRTFRLCAVAAMLASVAGAASASVQFIFNPTGGGLGAGAVNATTIDQAPGNALAINGAGAVTACAVAGGFNPLAPAVGVYNCAAGNFTTQLTYQANLAQLTNFGVPVFNQNGGGRNFTFTGSFTEKITQVAVLGVVGGQVTLSNATFVLNPVQLPGGDFMRMYYTGAAGGKDLTGAGFTSATMILEGHANTSSSSSTSDQTCTHAGNTCSNLDNFAGDNWGGFKTVGNNGSTQVQFRIDSANAGYFPDLPIGTVIAFDMNTSQVVPFNEADPACKMISATGVAQGYSLGTLSAGDTLCTADLTKFGGINGGIFFGPDGPYGDFLFQADANSSLDFQRIPEPGTLALLAGGLMGAGLWGRRRSAKK